MSPSRILVIFLIVILAASNLLADGPVGVYAMVQRVVYEPTEEAAARIQVWGLFVWVDGGLEKPGPINLPQRGYMYFKLPPNATQANAAKKQWVDIKAIVGTSQIVGFDGWTYAGPFENLYIPVTGGQEEVRVRKQTESPAKPITYPIKPGLVKVANDSSHADLYNLMKAFLQR